uniref:Transmembrane protein n=1 Tax=Heterorhabditis bacteriophora TaxID=37862 RepID=A0A1I7WW16_HETBA
MAQFYVTWLIARRFISRRKERVRLVGEAKIENSINSGMTKEGRRTTVPSTDHTFRCKDAN